MMLGTFEANLHSVMPGRRKVVAVFCGLREIARVRGGCQDCACPSDLLVLPLSKNKSDDGERELLSFQGRQGMERCGTVGGAGNRASGRHRIDGNVTPTLVFDGLSESSVP